MPGERPNATALKIPPSDTIAVRHVGRKHDTDGYIDNTQCAGDEGGHDDTFGRIKTARQPSDGSRLGAVHHLRSNRYDELHPFSQELRLASNDSESVDGLPVARLRDGDVVFVRVS